MPTPAALDLKGIDLPGDKVETLLEVNPSEWSEALLGQKEYFDKFGSHTPEGMWEEHRNLASRVAA